MSTLRDVSMVLVLVFITVRHLAKTILIFICIFFVFFFQAEDGIRDLVRSRGLGDVYKRQHYDRIIKKQAMRIHLLAGIFLVLLSSCASKQIVNPAHLERLYDEVSIGDTPVSYTHLTLPTSDLV